MDLLALQQIALYVAQAGAVDDVLSSIVQGLSNEPGVALARIWLIAPGDICASCPLRADCPDQTACLHLVASAGRSKVDPNEVWSGTEGRFRRFPLNVRKVGRIGATGAAALLHIGTGEDGWLADPDWARREGLRTFAGQPLIFRDEVLGVLALFTRKDFGAEELGWLRTFADHAAVALANARAFEEVCELRQQLELECDYLREEMRAVQAFHGIVGESPAIQKLLQQIETVAPTDATVLVEGESGTGKELIASAIHEQSSRRNRPLVRVNCASIPRELFESEFFGHTAGAFTGATRDRAGRFQVADKGTLFLDEVGEIPVELQGKLLRVLQEGQFSRVGEDTERKVDVRIVAATNRDLEQEVEAGRFRQDLYYRLTVFPVQVPPLRERRGDIPLLVDHFLPLATRGGRLGRRVRPSKSQLEALQRYDWPGNVRELQNVIERAVIGSRGGKLALEVPSASPSSAPAQGTTETEPRLLSFAELKKLERDNILAVLDHAHWKIAGPGGAADLLGVNPSTLASRLRAMGIERPRSGAG